MRLVWKVRGKRAARLHLTDGPSVEGILAGRWAGHYIMLTPSITTSVTRQPLPSVCSRR